MRLVVDGVDKSFGGTRVLDRCSLVVAEGELAAVLGPSGCGKTTLLRVIAGFERADAGTVTIGGREVTGLPPERRGVGIVPQEAALFPHLSVARNVGFGLPRGSRDRIEECLDLVGLAGLGDRMPHELSGGERQMLALGRALVARPRLLMLDEPSLGLAPKVVAQLMGVLATLRSSTGLAVLLVEQNVGSALSIADTAVVLALGQVVAVRPADQLRTDDILHRAWWGSW